MCEHRLVRPPAGRPPACAALGERAAATVGEARQARQLLTEKKDEGKQKGVCAEVETDTPQTDPRGARACCARGGNPAKPPCHPNARKLAGSCVGEPPAAGVMAAGARACSGPSARGAPDKRLAETAGA